MIRIPKWFADLGLWINRLYYRRLFHSVYGGRRRARYGPNRLEPDLRAPSWFDHRIDLHYHWPHNLFWLERGVIPRRHMFEGCNVLDLFCGDGFFSRYFYSTIAGHIDATDKDPAAIAHAKRWHSRPNIAYSVADATKEGFPRRSYDVVVWFEAIEHLTEEEYGVVVGRVKSAIGEKGVLTGSTPLVPPGKAGRGNWEHKNEFTAVEELREFLGRDFANVDVHTTVYPVFGGAERRTAYFTLKRPK